MNMHIYIYVYSKYKQINKQIYIYIYIYIYTHIVYIRTIMNKRPRSRAAAPVAGARSTAYCLFC